MKIGIAKGLPVFLRSDTDFKTPVTGKVFGDVTANYFKSGATAFTAKTVLVADWHEVGLGHYLLDFTGAELDTAGLFEYDVAVTGALSYPGLVELEANVNSDIVVKTSLIPSTPTAVSDLTPLSSDLASIVAKLPTNKIMGSSVASDYDTIIDLIKVKTDLIPSTPVGISDITALAAQITALTTLEKYREGKATLHHATVAVPARNVAIGMLESIDRYISATNYVHIEMTYDTAGKVTSIAFTEV